MPDAPGMLKHQKYQQIFIINLGSNHILQLEQVHFSQYSMPCHTLNSSIPQWVLIVSTCLQINVHMWHHAYCLHSTTEVSNGGQLEDTTSHNSTRWVSTGISSHDGVVKSLSVFPEYSHSVRLHHILLCRAHHIWDLLHKGQVKRGIQNEAKLNTIFPSRSHPWHH